MKRPIPRPNGLRLAAQLIERLSPACQRIRIAGSLRRRENAIGDIEIVAIPAFDQTTDMFGNPVDRASRLDAALDQLVAWGTLQPGIKAGSRYRQYIAPCYDIPIDLFITDPDRWGVVFTLRTGSADFSKWLVSPRSKGGAKPDHLQIHDGRVWSLGITLDTPEERDFFQALDLRWIPPTLRTAGLWNVRATPRGCPARPLSMIEVKP